MKINDFLDENEALRERVGKLSFKICSLNPNCPVIGSFSSCLLIIIFK